MPGGYVGPPILPRCWGFRSYHRGGLRIRRVRGCFEPGAQGSQSLPRVCRHDAPIAERTKGWTGSAPDTCGRKAGVPRRLDFGVAPRAAGERSNPAALHLIGSFVRGKALVRSSAGKRFLAGADRSKMHDAVPDLIETWPFDPTMAPAKKKKGKLRRQASILRRRGNYAEVEGCCCSALRTCLSRPDTECNLMTEQPGASRKKSERRSAPLSTP